jgi:hypothetical protein
VIDRTRKLHPEMSWHAANMRDPNSECKRYSLFVGLTPILRGYSRNSLADSGIN